MCKNFCNFALVFEEIDYEETYFYIRSNHAYDYSLH